MYLMHWHKAFHTIHPLLIFCHTAKKKICHLYFPLHNDVNHLIQNVSSSGHILLAATVHHSQWNTNFTYNNLWSFEGGGQNMMECADNISYNSYFILECKKCYTKARLVRKSTEPLVPWWQRLWPIMRGSVPSLRASSISYKRTFSCFLLLYFYFLL